MSITKKTAKYIVKNESRSDALLSYLQQYGLLTDVGKRLSKSVAFTANIFSEDTETLLLVPVEYSEKDVQAVMQKHTIDEHPRVVIDPTILDGYVLYHQGKKIMVTAQDRIQRFVNK